MDRPVLDGAQAENRFQRLGAPRSDQTAEPENFPFVQREADIPHQRPGPQVDHIEDGLSLIRVFADGITRDRFDITTDHQPDQLGLRKVCRPRPICRDFRHPAIP